MIYPNPRQSPLPCYWKDDPSGDLRPVVWKYFRGECLTPGEILTMRAYLRQWVDAPGFVGDEVDGLRQSVKQIRTEHDLNDWLALALDAGIDPL